MKRELGVIAVLLAGCALGRNYPAVAPRFAGVPERSTPPPLGGAIRVVSFNIEFALRVDSAIAVLTSDSALADADILLLQEMDGESTERIGRALGMWYVYYPAVFHRKTERDFGNAVLSRWPIIADARIVLPHPGRLSRNQRTATAATIDAGTVRIRAYSVHLGTVADVGPNARARQLERVLDDAREHERVVIGGDFNSATVPRVAQPVGYVWATEHGPSTAAGGRWDHIVFRGFRVPEGAAGVVFLRRGRASDHRPVWAFGLVEQGP